MRQARLSVLTNTEREMPGTFTARPVEIEDPFSTRREPNNPAPVGKLIKLAQPSGWSKRCCGRSLKAGGNFAARTHRL